MKSLASGEVLGVGDFWHHYVYELIDDHDNVMFVGSTDNPKNTLLRLLRPVKSKRQEVDYNMPLKRAISTMRNVRMRIVFCYSSQVESERARDVRISNLSKSCSLFNFNRRTM